MNKWKKVVGNVMVASMILTNTSAISVAAKETEAEKQYVILAENDAYEIMGSELPEDAEKETLESDTSLVVATLTEKEARQIEKKENVIIEEDVLLKASEEDDKEYSAEEKRKRRQEIKEKKKKSLEEAEETEDSEKEKMEWNLQAIRAENLDVSEDANGKIKVAVLDSGIDYVTGIDIAGSVNLVEEDEDILPIFQDMTGHGTGIASIIAANGENDIKGINPDVELYSVKILDKENSATLSRVIRGIYWCIENNINIINMSFGTNVYSAALEQAVKDAYDAGILMIGAAGNEGESVEYPAAFEKVMAVAATDEEANISDFSNRGDELEIAAPGEKVKVSGFFDGTSVTHGTSIAVPHVVGVASLVWEKDLNKSSEFVRQLIEQSAKQIDNINECGLLDAENTLKNYEEFEKIFDEEQGKASRRLEENQQAPERFEEISEDQAYVEGRWHGTDHQVAVDKGAVGFTTEAITNIKKGIVYPDGEASGWQNGKKHSRWHGKWEEYTYHYEINYIAACEMVTNIATENGVIASDITYDDYWGLSKEVFDDLKVDIKGLKSKYSTLLTTDTPENRKYFLYGCGLHIITDAFAHSTTKGNGTLIGHGYDNGDPDDTSYHHRRYQTAVKVVEYALKSLQDDIYCDGEEVIKALKQIYTDEATYKMIKIKKYVNDNGYSNAILSKVNIDTPKIPKS